MTYKNTMNLTLQNYLVDHLLLAAFIKNKQWIWEGVISFIIIDKSLFWKYRYFHTCGTLLRIP